MTDSEYLFYDDNRIGKRNWFIITTILIICFVGWTIAFILSFVIKPTLDGFKSNNFYENLVGNIVIIIFLLLILIFIIYLFIFRFKSNRFKQTLLITKEQIVFSPAINGKNIVNVKDYDDFEIINQINNFAKVNIKFSDNSEIIIKTHKYKELRLALMLIKNNN